VGCIFPMVIVSLLQHAEFGPNDHREDAPHFTSLLRAEINGHHCGEGFFETSYSNSHTDLDMSENLGLGRVENLSFGLDQAKAELRTRLTSRTDRQLAAFFLLRTESRREKSVRTDRHRTENPGRIRTADRHRTRFSGQKRDKDSAHVWSWWSKSRARSVHARFASFILTIPDMSKNTRCL